MINKKRKGFNSSLRAILFVFTVLLLFGPKQAEAQTRKLTIKDAIATAFENNRDIKVATLDVIKAEAAVEQTRGNIYPTVDLAASYSYFISKPMIPFVDFQSLLAKVTYGILYDEHLINEDIASKINVGNTLMSMSQSNNYEASIQATQILFNSAVFEGIKAAKSYVDFSRQQLLSKASATVHDVKIAFYGILLAQDMLTILEQSLKNAQDNLNNVKALNAQGLVSEYDTLQVAVQVENLKPAIYQLSNQLKNAKNGLKVLIGLDMNTDIELSGKLEYVNEELQSLDELINQSMKSNFDILTLERKKELDEASIKVDESGYWPSLAAFGKYTLAGSADDWNYMNYSSAIVGISLSMNLFNGFQTQKKVEQSLIAVEQTTEQISQLRDYIVTQIKSKVIEIERVKSNIEAQKRNIELAEKAYDIANARYTNGTGTQLEIQNADMALRTARTNMLQSVYDYIVAKTGIESLTGSLDESYISLLKK